MGGERKEALLRSMRIIIGRNERSASVEQASKERQTPVANKYSNARITVDAGDANGNAMKCITQRGNRAKTVTGR